MATPHASNDTRQHALVVLSRLLDFEKVHVHKIALLAAAAARAVAAVLRLDRRARHLAEELPERARVVAHGDDLVARQPVARLVARVDGAVAAAAVAAGLLQVGAGVDDVVVARQLLPPAPAVLALDRVAVARAAVALEVRLQELARGLVTAEVDGACVRGCACER